MRVTKTDCEIAAAFVGTMIGAGFASGQELMQFFVRFGVKGLWGVILAGLLFAFLGGITILMVKEYRLKTYKDLLDMNLGVSLANFVDGMIMIFLFLSISVMLSGSGALFQEYLGFPGWTGIFITELLVLLALLARDEGVLWFNVLLVPVLILVLVVISLVGLFTAPATGLGGTSTLFKGTWISGNWVCSSLLYVSYNMVGGVVILVALAGSKKNCGPAGGVIGGLILLTLALCVVGVLLVFRNSLDTYQIPMLYLAFKVSTHVFYLYGAVLWAAMLTTAVSNAYGLCRRLQFALNLPYPIIMGLILMAVIPFALCNFAGLVSRVYPLFGYLSLVVVFMLVMYGVKKFLIILGITCIRH